MPRKSRKTKAPVKLTYRLTRSCDLHFEGEIYRYGDTFLEDSQAPWVTRWLARGDLETVSEETLSEDEPDEGPEVPE